LTSARPRVLPVLKRHLDVVSVANNHVGDFGRDAFTEMLGHLDASGIPRVGGGRNLAEAHRPLVIEKHGLRIALLAYDEFFPRSFEAGPDRPGSAWSDDEQVADDIRRARTEHRADLVIPFMHWGSEGEPVANARQRQLARRMIDAGADAVVGAHPHVVQDAEVYRGKPVVYSLGNFVFDGFDSLDQRTGWMLFLTVDRKGVRQWHVEPVRTDVDGVPHPLRNAKALP
jgi:poly-gamma-glutamate capsule biosynthesis protein CapA/YwtB (metallophosphatase superfamily)